MRTDTDRRPGHVRGSSGRGGARVQGTCRGGFNLFFPISVLGELTCFFCEGPCRDVLRVFFFFCTRAGKAAGPSLLVSLRACVRACVQARSHAHPLTHAHALTDDTYCIH